MQNILFSLSPQTLKMLLSIFLTLLVAIITDRVLRSFIKIPKGFETRRAYTYATILRNVITISVYAIAFHLIFIEIGINLTPLLASAGIVGIVVGIGARSLFEDLINGFFLLTQEFIAVGDYVKLDTAEGYIEKIGYRALTIRGDSGELYIIPNGQVKMVINYSHHRSYQSIDIPIKTMADIDLAVKAMNEALKELQKDKEVEDAVFPGSSVNGIEEFKTDGRMILRATIITRPATRPLVMRKYRYLAKKNFEKYKIDLT